MARHRKIDVRMWGDEKFRRLSAPCPCGQFLWVYLLTGPHTTSLPGLFNIGEAALAEALGWSLKAFREAFAEAHSQGMVKADWKARVVWVPKAIEYNFPESPNVVKGWRATWDEMPECTLKAEAYHVFRQALKSKKAFHEAFGEGVKEPRLSAHGNPLANQEQEQEQDSKKKTPPTPQGGSGDASQDHLPPIPAELDTPEFREAWGEWLEYRRERKPRVTYKAATRTFKKLVSLGPQEAIRAIHHSIACSYQGVFSDTSGRPAPANGRLTPQSIGDKLDARFGEGG